jgi:hypothetical protein
MARTISSVPSGSPSTLLLYLAVAAQLADLTSFLVMATTSLSREANPLIRWVLDRVPDLPSDLGQGLAGVAFTLLKLSLVLFVVALTRRLQPRPRTVVLAAAIVVGLVGFASNLAVIQ